MKHTIYVCIKVDIETDLDYEDAVDQLGNEADYNIGSTDDVKVTDTEWLATESSPNFYEL